MKTYSYRQYALFISGILTFVAGFILFLGYYLNNTLSFIFIFLPIFMIISWFILNTVLKRYINEKIKPVYKTILDLPASTREEGKKAEKGEDMLTKAKTDVEEWAKFQIHEIERLRELERYRKEFLGNVSHELKTPIFNIQGYVLTLLEGGMDDPKINKLYLKRTEMSVDRLITIVEDLESITKLEAGELKLHMDRFDMVKMVEDVFDMQQMFANKQQVSLEFSRRPDRPVFVFVDRNRITEVLNNLINNGIKYSKKRGYIKVGFYDMEGHIMVEVSDNGIGIDKKEQKRVFERFYRVDKSRSRDQGGTGLGLSIVKHIIEAHQQTIHIKSAVDEGTTFTFTLEKAK